MANVYSGSDPKNKLRVREADGTPNVYPVDTIVVSNGTLTNDGSGTVTIATSRQSLGIYTGFDNISVADGRNQYTIDIQTTFGSILGADSVIQITAEVGATFSPDTVICWMETFDPTPGSNSITVNIEASLTTGPLSGNLHYTVFV